MKIIDRLEEWIISLMLLAMTTLTFVQVVMRYVFNSGFSWAQELTGLCFAFMIFVGISYGVRVGAHIGVDAVVRKLPSGLRRSVALLAVLLSLVYVGFVLAGATEYVSKMREVAIEFDDMPLERWQGLIVMPIGYALMGLRFLQILFNLVTGRAESLNLADEAADAMKLNAQEQP